MNEPPETRRALNRKSTYVCRRCGLPVLALGQGRFKHAASGTTGPGCGKAPQPISRVEHDSEIADLLAAARRFHDHDA